MDKVTAAIFVGFALITLSIGYFRLRIHLHRQKATEENQKRQEYLARKVEELDKLLNNPEAGTDEVRSSSERILQDMRATNAGGELDSLIEDCRESVEEALSERGAL